MKSAILSPNPAFLTWLIVLACLGLAPSSSAAQELTYTNETGQKFAYKVDITAEQNDASEVLEGVVVFTVKSASDETIQVGYSGGLTKTRNAKSQPASRGRPGFGPRGPGFPRGPGGPLGFFNNPFSGLTQTTNDLVVTPLGEVRSLKGTSQLPYLIGNLSIMFFEPLPSEIGKKEWTVRNGVSITEGGRSSRPPFFRPSPFDRDEIEQSSAAAELTSFSIQRADDKRVVVAKTYKLNMPAGDDSDANFEITGSGTWTYNRELKVPESLDFQQKLFVHEGNTSTTIPVSIHYKRLSPSELEAHQKDREEKIAAARKQLEDRKNKKASGLSPEEKEKVLADLNSGNKPRITSRMVQLKIVKPLPDDKDVALLIQKYIEDGNRPLRVMAQAAWGKWKVLVEEPAVTASDNPFALPQEKIEWRTWKDSSGKFAIEAEFVGLVGNDVKLKRKDGRLLSVPLSRLSKTDQDTAKRYAELLK